MTTATKPRAAAKPPRVQCPAEGCTYSAEPGSSIAGHVAMAHPEVPIDTVAPKRSARNDQLAHLEAASATVEVANAGGTSAPVEIPPSVGAALLTEATLEQIPLDLVDVGDNVRVTLEAIDELAASIAEHGVLQPVKATLLPDGRYSLLWGQRRVLAARQAGLATIPALVNRGADVGERPIEQLVENLHRADLNPIDRATAMRAVVDAGVSQADLARKLGIAPSTVANDLRLLGLDGEVVERIRTGELSASHGKAMASLPASHQKDLAGRIVHSKLSAHQVESELEWRRNAANADAARKERTEKTTPKLLAALEADVAKDVAIQLQGAYDLDTDALKKAVEKAGWTLVRGYAYDRPEKGKCDCKVVRIEFNRSWKITPACDDERHRDRQRNVDRQQSDEVRKAFEARLAALADVIELELSGTNQAILQLLIAAIGGNMGREGEPTPRTLAELVVRTWRVRELATPELVAQLTGQPAEATS